MTERVPLYLDSSGIASEIPVGDTVAANRLDLTDYLKLSGRAGGQTVYGGLNAGDDLHLNSTFHSAKGNVYIENAAIFSLSGANFHLLMNTSDGSDNASLVLCGGGGTPTFRGASIQLYGNEATFSKGDILLATGDGDGSSNQGSIRHSVNSLTAIQTKSRVASPGVSGFNTAFTSGTSTDSGTAGSGTAALSTIWSFSQPTIAASNSSVVHTDAATIYIANSPAAGTNITITNPLALLIAAGDVRFDDSLVATSGTKRAFFVQTTINPASNSSANLYAQQISLSVLGTVDKTGTLRAANFTGSVDAACNVTTLQGFNALVQIGGIAGNSKVATNLIGANVGIANLANSYTVTNGIGLKVQSPSNTGTGTITNTCGVMIDSHTAGTNDCHLLIGTATIPSGTFGIYVSTSNNNYFAGNVGINEVSPDYKLDVNGTLGFTPGSSVTPVDNGDVVIEATNNTTLTLKLKGSDGTIRTGIVTLA